MTLTASLSNGTGPLRRRHERSARSSWDGDLVSSGQALPRGGGGGGVSFRGGPKKDLASSAKAAAGQGEGA